MPLFEAHKEKKQKRKNRSKLAFGSSKSDTVGPSYDDFNLCFFSTMFLGFKWTFFKTLEQILAWFLITMNLFFCVTYHF